MATHTTTGATSGVRRLSIGRINGEKTGKPVFLEWLRELPASAEQFLRDFETRNSDKGPRYYERFQAVDGLLTGIRTESREVMGEPRTFLYIRLDDGSDIFDIEIGDYDGRYSINLMRRLCNPMFNPMLTLRLSPYAVEHEGRTHIGVAAYNGPDKLEARKSEQGWQMAEPGKTEHKGKTLYDWLPVADFLMDYLQKNVIPKLVADAWQVADVPASTTNRDAADWPIQIEPEPADLPF